MLIFPPYSDHLHTSHSDAGKIESAEEGLLHGVLQLLIPQAEYNGAQERCEYRVGDGYQDVALLRVETCELDVDDRGEAVVHDDHSKMRRTGGEGFVPALG